MGTNPMLSRRQFFLGLGGIVSLYVLTPFGWLWKKPFSEGEMGSIDALAGIITNKNSAAIIGREYLKMRPDEADAKKLVTLIGVGRDFPQSNLLKVDTKALRKTVQKRQCDDFECGRTIRIQGWVLSETESRLYALSSLT